MPPAREIGLSVFDFSQAPQHLLLTGTVILDPSGFTRTENKHATLLLKPTRDESGRSSSAASAKWPWPAARRNNSAVYPGTGHHFSQPSSHDPCQRRHYRLTMNCSYLTLPQGATTSAARGLLIRKPAAEGVHCRFGKCSQ